jgi:hypothetical protein
MDIDEVERKRRAASKRALTILRRTWTGAVLPYITLLERSGDPEKVLEAQTQRLRWERLLETMDDLMNGREPRWSETDLGIEAE